ncbi:MAG: hypothetical protein ACFE0Q_01460 [Anaerolineae bacterium]
MKYDVLLTDLGSDTLSVTLAVQSSIQQLVPLAIIDVEQARDWLTHLPILLHRGISETQAHDVQAHYQQLGATVSMIPSQRFFPPDAQGITRWHNDRFSEKLIALHEQDLRKWSQAETIIEAYRFSFLPTYGTDLTVRVWACEAHFHACARRGSRHIGPLPGPPAQVIHWHPSADDWQAVRDALHTHHFWSADSWDTVPDGYTIVATEHWVMEGVRNARYKVLVDQTPNEGSAREVGLLLLGLLPDVFLLPNI